MCKVNNNFSKNLKTLRKNYGETQLDLALAIGYDSDVPISHYENGKRYPKPDTLKKIAEHYRVSEDQLVNGIIEENIILEKKIICRDMSNAVLKAFPVICTDKALENPHFKKGLEYHKRCISALYKDDEDFDYQGVIEKSLSEYEKADIPEAYANLLWWAIIFNIIEYGTQASEYFDDIEYRKKYEIKELLKIGFLKDFSEADTDSTLDHEFLNDITVFTEKMINKLKSYQEWKDLVYFYTAVRYMFCYIDNGRSENQNREIGAEMMSVFYDLGNKYVRRFSNIFYKSLA